MNTQWTNAYLIAIIAFSIALPLIGAPEMSQFHVIDHDVIRRNRIARSISKSRHHAEIYDSLTEFLAHRPTAGMLLAADDLGSTFWAAMADGRCALPFALYGSEPRAMDVAAAIRGGALDFLEWPLPDSEIVSELERLLLDAIQWQDTLTLVQNAKKRVASLSPREREVIQLVTQGYSNKRIAQELGISARTVEIHRANTFKKLDAQSSAEAVRIAICAGLDPKLKVTW